jgi:hypothetical protein
MIRALIANFICSSVSDIENILYKEPLLLKPESMLKMTTQLNFIEPMSHKNAKDTHALGSVSYDNETDQMMIFLESGWTVLCDSNDTITIHKPENCRNCGAPVVGNKCEYCGTSYNSK